ncbi:helix-turn-helix domain-containing protein [Nocardiopsis sp. CA-288880]|uniref:helix-turn-helix domain-containing protein n=1 Tax=Nocardiopsis sp. CA-288880 TaxID=3239995 RepID=UPI003D96ECD0
MAENSGRTYSSIGPTGQQIGQNVAVIRGQQGVTTEQLAQRLTDVGVPIKASAITKVEKGQRRLTVDELVALAVVLDVNPSALMLPVEVDRDRPVEITGHGEVPAARAWQWVDGHKPLPGRASREQAEQFDQAVRPWWLRANTLTVADLDKPRFRPLDYDDPENET